MELINNLVNKPLDQFLAATLPKPERVTTLGPCARILQASELNFKMCHHKLVNLEKGVNNIIELEAKGEMYVSFQLTSLTSLTYKNGRIETIKLLKPPKVNHSLRNFETLQEEWDACHKRMAAELTE